MAHIHFDYSKVAPFVNEHELGYMQSQVSMADKVLREGTGAGSDFRVWIDLPTNYDKEEFARIKEAAKKIRQDSLKSAMSIQDKPAEIQDEPKTDEEPTALIAKRD